MPPTRLSSKLPDVGTTIFTVIADQISRHRPLNLAQGAPNFPCERSLIDRVTQAMLAGHNQYAPMTGLATLRERLSEKAQQLYGQHYDAEREITITASASEAIYSAIAALVHPGDEVIYFEPGFDSYAPIVRLQGATPVGIALRPPQFSIDWREVAAAVNPRTRMIILNTPQNPTGQILDDTDIAELTKLVAGTDIMILSDEVYEHMVYDGARHTSMARYPELAERSVVVASFGKTFHVTGWRIGYCLAPAELTTEIRKVHQFLMFSADTPMQYALAEHLRTPAHYLGLADFYQAKRDLLRDCLAPSRLKLLPCQGSFFMLASYADISDEPDAHFVQRLIEGYGIATMPLSAFYSDGTDNRYIRLSFARDDDHLKAGAAVLCKV